MKTMKILNTIRNIILDISCILFSGFMIAFIQNGMNNSLLHLLFWIISTISVIPLAVTLTNITSTKS